MLELTGIGSILRGISFLYWLLAAVALLVVLKKTKTTRTKVIGVVVVIGVFGIWPLIGVIDHWKHQTYARQAWAYFKNKCDTESGEKIYKTFTGVKSVLVVKPLPPATDEDNYNQFWYGDPYSASATSMRVDNAAGTLVYPDAPISMQQRGRGFEFVESYVPQDKTGEKKLIKYYFQPAARDYRTEPIAQPVSRFGLAWEDISTPEDRKFWVAGSRLRVIDLTDNSIVAERIGYLIEAGFGSKAGQRRPWLSARGVDKRTFMPICA